MNPGDTQHFTFKQDDPPPIAHPTWVQTPGKYVDKSKGLKQVLQERGLWKAGMTLAGPKRDGARNKSLSAKEVLSQCKDFIEEKNDIRGNRGKKGPHATKNTDHLSPGDRWKRN